MFCFVHRCLKLPRFWSEAMNSVRFLHLSTTARRNSPYSNPFSQSKAKTVTERAKQCRHYLHDSSKGHLLIMWGKPHSPMHFLSDFEVGNLHLEDPSILKANFGERANL